jgi:hypothetical protein
MSSETIHIIVSSLLLWLQGELFAHAADMHLQGDDLLLIQPYDDQLIIGWDQLYKGYIALS